MHFPASRVSYLQFVFKDVLNELGHNRLWAAKHLAHLFVDPLTENRSVLEHIIPHVGSLNRQLKKKRQPSLKNMPGQQQQQHIFCKENQFFIRTS